MKKYINFDKMFNDNDYVSDEDQEIIDHEVKLIENLLEPRESNNFVAEVRAQAKVYPNQQAIVQAVDVCIKKNILKDFLLENKKEVVDMVFFEYDAEAEKRVIYKDGKEDGEVKGMIRLCKKFNMSKDDTIRELETELSLPAQSANDYYEKFSKELENNFSEAQKII